MIEDRLDDELAHAPCGPSAAEGWSTCADYINANKGLPEDPSEPAAEGTAAHAISDYCLNFGFDAYDCIGWSTRILEWEFIWDDDDADLLQPGLERVREMPGTFFSERRVDISTWTIPGQFGTLDRGIITADVICIDDLKWGRGIPVSPVKNKQLMLYALGFWNDVARHHTDATDFLLRIDQPRCSGGGGEWRTTLAELQEFGAWIKTRAVLTQGKAPRTASAKGCLWCKRRNAPGGCETYDEYNLALFGAKFEDLDDPAVELTVPRKLTPERRSYVIRHAKMLDQWLEHLQEEALADALAGLPVWDLKAVEGRKSPDKWIDKAAAEEAVVPILADRSFTKKLITPTQAGKLISPEIYEAKVLPQIVRGSKKPTLVPLEDAREAIKSHESKFDEET